MARLIIIALIGMLSFNAWSLSLNEIQTAIKKKGAKWQADNSWVWQMPQNTKKNMMGTKVAPKPKFIFYPYRGKDTQYPRHLDWHNMNGINFMSPVTNQGKCGSCVAFASVATLEGVVNVVNNWPGLNYNFAEQHIWACGSGRCDRGWTLGSAAYQLKNVGVADEACMPYMSGANGTDLSCNQACSDASSRALKIKSYESFGYWYVNTEELIEALQEGPLMARMTVYEDFPAYSGGIYEHVTGGTLGGHAVTLVGYDLDEQYWIVKNSWGEEWGENGYFRIKMDDDSNVGPGSYQFLIDPFVGAAKIEAPAFKEVVSGNYRVRLMSTFENTTGMKLTLYRDGRTYDFQAKRQDKEHFYIDFNTTALQDGVYFAKAVALREGKSERSSQYKRFFVVNNRPQINITMNNLEDGQTVSDRVYIEFAINTTPVPLEKLVLKMKDSQGKIGVVESGNIAEHTLLGWRTYLIPNGEYEIWAEGVIGKYVQETQHLKVTVAN